MTTPTKKTMAALLDPSTDEVDLDAIQPDLREALAVRGNDRCADCRAERPHWVEVTRGITLCRPCATEHHLLGSDLSRIRCIKAGESIDSSVIKLLEQGGNEQCNADKEAYLSKSYKRPAPYGNSVYRKHFIGAKYVRHEFCSLEGTGLQRKSIIPQPYITGEISYPLLKRGRANDTWLTRCLEAYATSGSLRYMDKEGKELGSIPLGVLNVALVSDKDMNGDSDTLIMIVTYPEDAKTRKPSNSEAEVKGAKRLTRSLFFKGFEFLAGRDIVEWYVAIRYAKTVHVGAVDGTKPEVTTDIKKLGWLHKKKRVTDPFRLRWFVLEDNVVRYSEHPMDAVPKGEFELQRGPGYGVIEGIEGDEETPFAFTIITPGRDYYLHSTSESYKSWLDAFGSYCLHSASLSTT
eukprot:scpid40886/ scgid15292/ Arf-GAP with dual PH domain-containing protein 1; Centaurin-alpha-1; Putative MAPK-activating protein PM25